MAELIKLTFPGSSRVVELSEELATHYSALGWERVEQKTEAKEATNVTKRQPTRRKSVSHKDTDSK